ncbi:MAG TPA: F0F1 ATP synthase subunit delta [Candidatus Saccharimonadales bacterium]|nr:F0F1 ATP synthase subunit delta [Candidatus Saccharimonadales bacterium]
MKTPRLDMASAIAAHTYYDGGISKAYARQIAAMLLYEGRVGELESLLRDVQADWALHGYVEVIARSAHTLGAETKQQIVERIKKLYPSAEKIVVTPIEDTSVVGGVRLGLADRQLDLSVAAKLNKFKQLTGAGKE